MLTRFVISVILLAVAVNGQGESNQRFTVTSTNSLNDVFVDNEKVETHNHDDWMTADIIYIHDETRLVAIRASNFEDGCSGILAEISGSSFGHRLVTDRSWKCSANLEDGWNLLGFDDSHWNIATEIGLNGIVPGCSFIPINTLPNDAFWIWTENYILYDVIVHCRAYLPVCDNQVCHNGGTCQPNHPNLCRCPARFGGRYCNESINECESNPCQNSGVCQEDDEGYHCICGPFATGINCETDTSLCNSAPCQNDATCIPDLVEGYYCSCVNGYTGRDCETDIDECESNPCLNGMCIDKVGEFECDCFPGFTGALCEQQIDFCISSPCLNSGTCVSGINSYTCQCHPGSTGTHCETGYGLCETNPCRNLGNCTLNGPGDTVQCICPDGYYGNLCESEVDHCASNPCMHNATCITGDNQYTCQCNPVYTGIRCDAVLPHCGDIMAQSTYSPSRNFWVMCEINVIDHGPHLDTPCQDLVTGVNHYGDADGIRNAGGTFGCFVTRFPDEMADGACINDYNNQARLSTCLSCTHMGCCINVPQPGDD